MSQTIFTIQPVGNFDGSQTHEFREQVKVAIASQSSMVVLDCQDLIYIDSTGLGELILAYKSIRSAGSHLVLCSINDQIKTLLTLTDMLQVFEVYADRDAI